MILYGDDEEDDKRKFTFRTSRARSGTTNATISGIVPQLQRRYEETSSDYVKEEIDKLMTSVDVRRCHGARLKPEALAVTMAN